MALGFTWDAAKSAANARKHGVELIGATKRELIVIVSHTEGNDTIRIISARKATRHERATYEEDQ